MEAAATVVIKVKYGEMLRRFNALIVDDKLSLTMDGLREKILSLFSFPSETQLMLTYIDADGDVVTLVDAEDLHDVVKQGLNPIRITIKLSEENASQFSHSSGSLVEQPSQNPQAVISEIRKTMPELREKLMKLCKLCMVLKSKTSSSPSVITPPITQLVDYFSKKGFSYQSQPSESQTGAQIERPEATTENNKVEVKNVTGAKAEWSAHDSRKVNAGKKEMSKNKLGESSCKSSNPPSAGNNVSIEKEVTKPSKPHLGPKNANTSAPNPTKGDDLDGRMKCLSPGGFVASPGPTWEPNPGSSNYEAVVAPHSATFECPFSGIAVGNTPAASNPPIPFRRSSSQNDGTGIIFHRGICCDGCGVHPITGPRFKSKVKVDYDLCSICFSEVGNSTDYIRMDRPAVYWNNISFKGLYDSNQAPALPQICSRVSKIKSFASKLDSRFIQDVNVCDGTIMAPLTPFTKIWRMRNNGMAVWPCKTQLIWIGGDRLNNQFSVELEIPAAGLPVEQELDVSVGFISPELPGRYISYWRMASPSGQKFGQRVWVLIQVDASMKVTPHESISCLNLNVPPVSSCLLPEIINVNPEPTVEDSLPEPANSKKEVEIFKHLDLEPYICKESAVGASSSAPGLSVPTPVIHKIDPPPPPPPPTAPIASAQESEVDLPGENRVEEKRLKELDEMGFKQVDLNKEILRMNEYDLERSVDDLCGVADWDPILEELQEMGFQDTEVNKKLLKKNNGSIKRVVMDLIAGEKM